MTSSDHSNTIPQGPCAPERPTGAWDRVGVWASSACAVHCLAAPLLFLAAPALADLWTHPLSHAAIAALVLPLAATVLLRGYRLHRRRWVATCTALGCVAILVGCVLPFASARAAVGTVEAVEAVGAVGTAAHIGACHASCCPELIELPDGGWRIGLTPASIASLLGSALLVAGHLGNLIGCRSCR